MREDGARFGKCSKGRSFGFKPHAVRHIAGRVMDFFLTPANQDDHDPAPALSGGVDGGVASVHRPGVWPVVERAMEYAQAQGAALQPGSCRRRVCLSQLTTRISLRVSLIVLHTLNCQCSKETHTLTPLDRVRAFSATGVTFRDPSHPGRSGRVMCRRA